MKIENTKAQMRKGVLEFCILSVLKNKDAYVAEILKTLKEAKLLVVEGTIYPFSHGLKILDSSITVGKNPQPDLPESITHSLKLGNCF